MKNVWQRWNDWWFAPVEPQALAVARIATGIGALIHVLWRSGDVTLQYSLQGIALPLYTDLPTPLVAHVLYALWILVLIGWALGWHMRVCGVLSVLLGLYFWQLSFHMFPATFHRLYLLFFLILIPSGADRAYSIRSRRADSRVVVSVLPQRLLALQITLLYVASGWQKVVLPAWQDGQILEYGLMSGWATLSSFWVAGLSLSSGILSAAVVGVTLFEQLLPIGLWRKQTWLLAAVLGTIFHLINGLLFNIWGFMVLVPMYVLFRDPIWFATIADAFLQKSRNYVRA